MNYIKKLQQEVKEKDEQIQILESRIRTFQSHLDHAKFKGPGNDYIQTQDVRNWIDYITAPAED